MDTVNGIDLSAPAVSSLVMRDLSEYATLAFLAAFDVQPSTLTQTGPKRITYIALMKKTMPLLVDLYVQFKAKPDLYADGTLEAVISVCLRSLLSFVAFSTKTLDMCACERRIPFLSR